MDTQLLPDSRIASHEDIVLARQRVRSVAQEIGFNLLDQTRIVTAVSELTRNIVIHAGSGTMAIFKCLGRRIGIRIVFTDSGPGIADVGKALEAGYSTAGSLGLGLKGAKNLTDSMEIVTVQGKGTTVTICKWL